MEDANASQQGPPEEEVAENLQEGSSDSSEDEEAASFADDSPESYVEPDVVKAMRRLAKHRASLIPLAVLASALVLALVPKVELIGPPGVGGLPEKTPKKPMVGAFGTRTKPEAAEKPKVEPFGPPEVGGVPEETPKKPVVGGFGTRIEGIEGIRNSVTLHHRQTVAKGIPKLMRLKLGECALVLSGSRASRKDKSLDEEDLWDSRLKLIWRTNGVKYELLAHFTKLTPAYDGEETAAELEKGIPELLEEARLYEEHAREGEDCRVAC
ncbi:hypothetical protein Emed_007429 [Eimeria media]